MDKPLSRYSATEYNRSERILRRIKDIYSRARSFHLSHQRILELVKSEVYDSPDWAKLTPYYRGVYFGTYRALSDALYQYHLEWRLYLDGKLVPSKEVPPGRWSDVKGGEHVWSDAPDKLFSSPGDQVMTCTNCNGPLPTGHGTTGPEGHKFCDHCAGIAEALAIGARQPVMLYESTGKEVGGPLFGYATSWTGVELGTIKRKTRPELGYRGAVRFRVRMLDGSLWYGHGPTSNGSYIRLRPMKGE